MIKRHNSRKSAYRRHFNENRNVRRITEDTENHVISLTNAVGEDMEAMIPLLDALVRGRYPHCFKLDTDLQFTWIPYMGHTELMVIDANHNLFLLEDDILKLYLEEYEDTFDHIILEIREGGFYNYDLNDILDIAERLGDIWSARIIKAYM